MEIGKPERIVIVEPVEDPVRRREPAPVRRPEREPEPAPKPERVRP
jgi:hypothetical protein